MATATTVGGRDAWHTLPGLEAARALDVDRNAGLCADEARARLVEVGANELVTPARAPAGHTFGGLTTAVPLLAGVVVLCLGDIGTGLALIAVAALNAALAVARAGTAAPTPRCAHTAPAQVRRDGRLVTRPCTELVPGDVVRIVAGDIVPADGRLLTSRGLQLDESVLTGDGVPVDKGTAAVDDPDAPLGARSDMVYMRTRVTRGSGELAVTATGMDTEFGALLRLLRPSRPPRPPLADGAARHVRRQALVAAAAIALVVVIELARGATAHAILLAASTIALASTPAGIGVVVTVLLAIAAHALPKARARRLTAIDALGATTALVIDKTGTVTLNQLTAIELVLPGRRYTVTGHGYRQHGVIRHLPGRADSAPDALLLPMALASDAEIVGRTLRGDPRDGALVVLAEKGGLDVAATREAYPRIAQLPYDSAYELTASFHRMRDERGDEVVACFATGSPELLLARAAFALDSELSRIAADAGLRDAYLGLHATLRRRGLRVIALARRDLDPAGFDPGGDLLPLVDGLTLLALVAIADPPRRHARTAVDAARDAGIEVHLITGEDAAVAGAIASRIGLGGRVADGAELAARRDDAAPRELAGIAAVARVTPAGAARVVELLQRQGHVVAMAGDGVNDAPALAAADAGIASRDAADTARWAASVIVDGGLRSVVAAIASARSSRAGLTRAVAYLIAMSAAALAICTCAAVLGLAGALAVTPLQLLYLDLTVLASQSLALGIRTAVPVTPGPRRLAALLALLVAGSLAAVALGDGVHSADTAHAMGFVTFGVGAIALSLAWRRPDRVLAAAGCASLAAVALGAILLPA